MEERMLLWAYLIFAGWSGLHFLRRRGVFGIRFLVGVIGVAAVSAAGLQWPDHRRAAFWVGTAGFLVFLLLPGLLVGVARRAAGAGRFRAACRLIGVALLSAPAVFLRSERDLYRAAAEEEGEFARGIAERIRTRVAAAGGGGPAPVSLAIAVAVVIVHLLVTAMGDSRSALTLLELGANHLPLVLEGEWFRLVTAMFLHSGLLHLFLNATAIWIVGRWVEPDLGPGRTWLIFAIGGVAGNVASLVATAQASIPLPSVGASGGAMALLGAVLPLTLRRGRSAERASRLQTTALIIGATLVLGFVEPVIDDGAHLGGLLAGAVLGLAFTRLRLPAFAVRVGAIAMLGIVVTAAGLDVVSVRRWRSTETLALDGFTVEYPAFLRSERDGEGLVLRLVPLVEARVAVSEGILLPFGIGVSEPVEAPEGWTADRHRRYTADGQESVYTFCRNQEGARRYVRITFTFAEEDPMLLDRIATPVVRGFRFR